MTQPSGGSRRKWTWSAWVKKSSTGANQSLCVAYQDSANWTSINFETSDQLNFYEFQGSSVVGQKKLSMMSRDTNGWYHFMIIWDSENTTADDRMIIYVNGVRQTAFSASTNPSVNTSTAMNRNNYPVRIGTNNSNNYFNGSMSHVNFCGGSVLAPTVFGETDATTGEWKIISDPTFTPGIGGYSILKDGNTITDQSANSNNFSLGGGTLTKTEDSPSNVFATLNPLDKHISGTAPTFVNGNTRWTASGANNSNCGVRATMGASSGKYYFEAKYVIALYTNVGMSLDNGNNPWNGDGDIAGVSSFYGVQSEGKKRVAGVGTSSVFSALSNNDIGMFAYDLDNNKFWFGVNGSWVASGNPTTGDNPLGTLASGTYLPSLSNGSWGTASSTAFNFGNGYFRGSAVSSAGSNASGNGIFEYDVPTGYTALSTKGLNL